MTSQSLASAVREWQSIVGEPWVFTSTEDVALYRDSYSPLAGEQDERVASAAVAPASAEEVQRVFHEASKAAGLPPTSPFSAPLNCWRRSFVCIIGFPIFKDPEINERNRVAFRKMVRVAAEPGWGEYRTHSIYYDDIADTYSYGDHALRHAGGPGHPGSDALAAKYKGSVPAELEKRMDLPESLIRGVVRNGISVMPIFRKTEISDADLKDIVAYLNRH